MSKQNRGHKAPVVSLAEFKKRVVPAKSEQSDNSHGYEPLDYLTVHAIGRVLDCVRGEKSKPRLAVVGKIVDTAPRVVSTTYRNTEMIAIDANRDHLEAVTLDLLDGDEETQKYLEPAVTKLYYSTLVAKHELELSKGLRHNKYVSDPMIGREVVKMRNDPERWENVTYWRAAAGLGMVAVYRGRPTLRQEVDEYLDSILEYRHNYSMGVESISRLTGNRPDDKNDIDEFMLGFCNPLTPMDIKQLTDCGNLPKE